MKKRIDRVLVERGLADTREKAQALVMAGHVLVAERPVTKPGAAIDETAPVRLKQEPHPYVGRGGVKLEGALDRFEIPVRERNCADIGSSTGGFTHCLLMRGAARVYAVDVDVQQLEWKLRRDPRVRTVEKNARYLEAADLAEVVDLVTVDVSFISLDRILPRVPAILKRGGHCVALVKPQFEVGRKSVGKGGIVRDPDLQREAVDKVREAGRIAGLAPIAECESSILGREGNREFFVLFEKT